MKETSIQEEVSANGHYLLHQGDKGADRQTLTPLTCDCVQGTALGILQRSRVKWQGQ